MGSQNNYLYQPGGRGSEPRYILYQDMYQYLEAPANSAAMYRNYSDESYGSTRSRLTEATEGSSPNTAMSYDTPSPNCIYNNYEANYTPYLDHAINRVPRQDLDSIPPLSQRPSSKSHHEDKLTPSKLGWSLDFSEVNYYSFVIKKGKEPYLELLPAYAPTPQIPKRVYLDYQKNHTKGSAWFCQFPGPCGKKFKRSADLERHYINVHADENCKVCLPCDYEPCYRSKAGNELNRKDHLRDHYRDYHKEDIGHAKHTKHGKLMSKKDIEKADKVWKEERVIDVRWWRCAKDLVRVYVSEGGWECGICKGECEPERVMARISQGEEGNVRNRSYDDQMTTYEASVCPTCAGNGWVQDMAENWEACSNCYQNTASEQAIKHESTHVHQQPADYRVRYSKH